jgi:8-oxo-dGTP pyrophosphatase MutT (NUDIX family)
MKNMTDYFQSMTEKGQIRIGARAIITNNAKNRFLVEKNHCEPNKYLNFIGGGLELGETLAACLIREIQEETSVDISRMEYLFFVENFISFDDVLIHGIGFYYLVELEKEEVESASKDFEFIWFSKKELADLDLRPYIVRDCIANGSYRSISHLISRNEL